MQMLVTPGKQALQDGMEVRQGGMAVHQHATPDEWTNTTQDDAELVDTEWCPSGSHALRVAQRIGPLKGSPRYLALSYPVPLREVFGNVPHQICTFHIVAEVSKAV